MHDLARILRAPGWSFVTTNVTVRCLAWLVFCEHLTVSEVKMATIRKRGKSWQAQIRLAECPAKSKSFPTKKAAEHWVRIITHQMLDNKATPPASRHTVASLLEQYCENIVSLKISKAANTSIDMVCRWWDKFPDAAIGVPTGCISGIVAIDIDIREDKNV